MKTTKLKDFKNMAFIPCFLFFPPTSLPYFYAFPFTVKKWLIFAKSYYYRSMCYPMYERAQSTGSRDKSVGYV